MNTRNRLLLISLGCLVVAACATTKAPILQVEALKVGKIRVTGAGMNVAFRVQNPNPEALYIERFEYELKLNGRSLGRGYYADPIQLDGFKDTRLDSSFGLNFLRLPGAVQEMLQDDKARVEVKGSFYVRKENDGTKKLGFKHDANVDLKK